MHIKSKQKHSGHKHRKRNITRYAKQTCNTNRGPNGREAKETDLAIKACSCGRQQNKSRVCGVGYDGTNCGVVATSVDGGTVRAGVVYALKCGVYSI